MLGMLSLPFTCILFSKKINMDTKNALEKQLVFAVSMFDFRAGKGSNLLTTG